MRYHQPAGAQSSIFDVRGLGIPQPPISARAVGMNGSGSMLDGMSGTNPAAITSIIGLSVGFNVFQNWRVEHLARRRGIGIRRRGPLRDGGEPDQGDAVLLLRELRVLHRPGLRVRDHRYDRRQRRPGRLPRLARVARRHVGFPPGARLPKRQDLALGFGFHFITGSNRFYLNRTFSDSVFTPVRQRSELAYNAVGFSLGAVYHPIEPLLLTAMLRHDGQMNVDRDSLEAYTYELPWTLAGSAQYQLGTRGTINAEVSYTTWADANAEIVANGGVGAENTLQRLARGRNRDQPGAAGQAPVACRHPEQAVAFSTGAGPAAKRIQRRRRAPARASRRGTPPRTWRSSACGGRRTADSRKTPGSSPSASR